MPYENFKTNDARSKFRKKAWRDSCCDYTMWMGLLLATTSAVLSLTRNQTSTDDRAYNTLFGCEFGALMLALLLDYYSNIKKIENLRLLHAVNEKTRFTDEEAALPEHSIEKARLIERNYPDGYRHIDENWYACIVLSEDSKAPNTIKSKTIIMQKNGDTLTAYWRDTERDDIRDQSFPIKDVENIIALLPKPAENSDSSKPKSELISSNPELITAIVDKYKCTHGYPTNGLTKGVSVPANLGLGVGLVLGITSLVTFFTQQNRASTICGTIAPIASTYINAFTRARYEQEESALEQITQDTADNHEQERATGAMVCRIATCGKC